MPERTVPPAEARTWAMLCHLAAFLALVGVPLGHLIGPFVAWLVKRDQHEFVDRQSKEAINFQLSLTLYLTVTLILAVYRLVQLDFESLPFDAFLKAVGIPALCALAIVLGGVVLTIVASIKANSGEDWEYPFTIRLLK